MMPWSKKKKEDDDDASYDSNDYESYSDSETDSEYGADDGASVEAEATATSPMSPMSTSSSTRRQSVTKHSFPTLLSGSGDDDSDNYEVPPIRLSSGLSDDDFDTERNESNAAVEFDTEQNESNAAAVEQSELEPESAVVTDIFENEDALLEHGNVLLLAIEQDRVDIMNAVLDEIISSSSSSNNADASNSVRHDWLHACCGLHVGIYHGSVNSINAILRHGVNPNFSVDDSNYSNYSNYSNMDMVEKIRTILTSKSSKANNTSISMTIEMFCDTSALSIAELIETHGTTKRTAICNAFFNELLRCIGNDDVDRLELLHAYYNDSDGKSLLEWCVDLNAVQCVEFLKSTSSLSGSAATKKATNLVVVAPPVTPANIPITPKGNSTSNQNDELKKLYGALSACRDNLAEEVSVCTGLLLSKNGGIESSSNHASGGSSLAAHVRSLKSLRSRKEQDIEGLQHEYHALYRNQYVPHSQQYCYHCGVHVEEQQEEFVQDAIQKFQQQQSVASTPAKREEAPPPAEVPVDGCNNDVAALAITATDSPPKSQSGTTNIADDSISKLRNEINILSDEHAKLTQQVSAHGLFGSISLIRSIRLEIQELDETSAQLVGSVNVLRSNISVLSQLLQQQQPQTTSISATSGMSTRQDPNGMATSVNAVSRNNSNNNTASQPFSTTRDIATGDSTALVSYATNASSGYNTIFHIFLRMIGLNHIVPPSAKVVETTISSSASDDVEQQQQPTMEVAAASDDGDVVNDNNDDDGRNRGYSDDDEDTVQQLLKGTSSPKSSRRTAVV